MSGINHKSRKVNLPSDAHCFIFVVYFWDGELSLTSSKNSCAIVTIYPPAFVEFWTVHSTPKTLPSNRNKTEEENPHFTHQAEHESTSSF